MYGVITYYDKNGKYQVDSERLPGIKRARIDIYKYLEMKSERHSFFSISWFFSPDIAQQFIKGYERKIDPSERYVGVYSKNLFFGDD